MHGRGSRTTTRSRRQASSVSPASRSSPGSGRIRCTTLYGLRCEQAAAQIVVDHVVRRRHDIGQAHAIGGVVEGVERAVSPRALAPARTPWEGSPDTQPGATRGPSAGDARYTRRYGRWHARARARGGRARRCDLRGVAQGAAHAPRRTPLPRPRAHRQQRDACARACGTACPCSSSASTSATRCACSAAWASTPAGSSSRCATSSASSPAIRPSSCPARGATSTTSTATSTSSCSRSTTTGCAGSCEAVLGEPGYRERFRTAPATENGHHAYAGGLAEHTVAVAALCRETAQLHPRLDADLLTAAALLHDCGCVDAFVRGAVILPSERGALLGHVHLGLARIERAGARVRIDEASAAAAARRRRLAPRAARGPALPEPGGGGAARRQRARRARQRRALRRARIRAHF